MDNNSLKTAAPAAGPELVTTTPDKGGNRIWIWIVVGLVVILVIGGAYWYLSQQQATPSVEIVPQNTKQTAESTTEKLDQDLGAIDVGSSDSSDFKSVDADLQSL